MDIRGALVECVLPQPVHDMHDMLVVGIELFVSLAQFDQLFERGQVAGPHFCFGRALYRARQVVELDQIAVDVDG